MAQQTIPSRDFMVRQAVLNAMHEWSPFYQRGWLIGWGDRPLPRKFHERVLAEFRKLAARYGA